MAQTLAELLVKIKTEGADQVKRELRDIEEALRKANTASERNIKTFERTQSRIIAGQKKMLTSGGTGGGATSMGIDPKALDDVTQALKDMAGPLNSVIDGATQVMQIFSIGSAKAALNLDRLRGMLANLEPPAGYSKREASAMKRTLLDMEPMSRDEADVLARMSGYGDIDSFNNKIMKFLSYEQHSLNIQKQIAQEEQRALPLHERFWGGLSSMASTAGPALMGVVGAVVAVGVALASATFKMYEFMLSSRQAGREFQDMQTRLKAMALGNRSMGAPGVMGSVTASANADIALARSQAGPSRFTTKQMTDQIVQLRAFGLNAGRILPLIAKVGQAFGANDQDLGMYTNAFGQLAGGQMPDVQVLNRMGITKQALKNQGVKFKGSELISSTETVMVAMEKIINGKFGQIFELTKDDASSMAASIEDAFDGIRQKVGLATESGLKPFYAEMQKVLSMMESGKFAEAFSNDLLEPLRLFGMEIQGFQNVFAGVMAMLSASIATFVHSISRMPRGIANLFGRNKTIGERITGLTDIIAGSAPGGGILEDQMYFNRKSSEYYKLMTTAPKGSGKVPANKDPFGGILPFGGGDEKDEKSKAKRTLEKIENNTRKSAELLDLRRQTIGGGEIASLGITGAEIAGMGLKNRSEISLRSPIRPDTQVIRGIKDLVYGNLNFALQGSPLNRVRF